MGSDMHSNRDTGGARIAWLSLLNWSYGLASDGWFCQEGGSQGLPPVGSICSPTALTFPQARLFSSIPTVICEKAVPTE